MMEFKHRKLLEEAENTTDFDDIPDLCPSSCLDSLKSSGYCTPSCETLCPGICTDDSQIQFPPPSHPPHPLNKLLIVFIVVISTVLLGICCYTVYVKYVANRRRSEPSEEDQETHGDFFDEDRGPVVDHHVWHINTIGLQPSVISAITVCNYKRGEGLVEGTECSVCLNEFQEDETLRLLPKCSHAFHIPCIDTWLRSHTSCPMCRAPVVNNTGEASSSGTDLDNSGGTEEDAVQNVTLESSEESDTEMEDDAGENELAVENGRKRGEILDEEVGAGEELQPIRRSFSLDSLSALKITQNLANAPSMLPNINSNARMVKAGKSGRGSFSQRIIGDLSLLRVIGDSFNMRSSKEGSSLGRNQNQNSILPS